MSKKDKEEYRRLYKNIKMNFAFYLAIDENQKNTAGKKTNKERKSQKMSNVLNYKSDLNKLGYAVKILTDEIVIDKMNERTLRK